MKSKRHERPILGKICSAMRQPNKRRALTRVALSDKAIRSFPKVPIQLYFVMG